MSNISPLNMVNETTVPAEVEDALMAARDLKVKRFIFASSCAVYGESPVLPKEESMLASPYNPYGAAALVGEELSRVFYATYRLETVCLRLLDNRRHRIG